jgi:hypothetical protein
MVQPYPKPTRVMLREQMLAQIEKGFRGDDDFLARLERHRMENALFLEFNDLSVSEPKMSWPDPQSILTEVAQERIAKLCALLNRRQRIN